MLSEVYPLLLQRNLRSGRTVVRPVHCPLTGCPGAFFNVASWIREGKGRAKFQFAIAACEQVCHCAHNCVDSSARD